MKIKTFFAAIFAVLAVSCFAATDTIDELEIQSGIRFPDGSYQTSAYTGGETSEIQNLWFSLATLQTNLLFISNNFINANGSVPMASNLNMGGNSVTNVRSFQNGGVSVGFQEGAEVVEIVGDLYIDGAGSELNFTDRGDGKRELRLGYGLELLDGNIDMGGNSITNISNSSNSVRFANGTYFGAQSVSNWNAAYNSMSNSASNVWTKSDVVTNAIPKDGSISNNKIAPDAVTAISIAPDAVGTDEIIAGAVTASELNTNLFTIDLGLLGNAMFVKGLLNSALPPKAGNAGKTLGLDNSSNWVFRASGVGDMLEANYSKTNPVQYFVDKALFANRSTNAEGILGYPAVTNGRADNAVIVFSLVNGRYQHISLSDLGGGDMFRSTYAISSLANPGAYTGYVDKSINSITSDVSRTTTNATGLLGKPAVTNGRADETVLTYDENLDRYYHVTLSSLGAGDMLKNEFATVNHDKVNQIDTNCISSNNIINSSVSTDDIANGAVTPEKTTNLVSVTTSFASINSDLDGTVSGGITVEKLKGVPITFGGTTTDYILGFASNGSITSKVDSAISPSRTPHTLTIDGTTDSVSFGLSNNYYYIHLNAKVTNWNITLPTFGDGVLYKLDMLYVTNTAFAWGGSLAICTNLPTPPPVGYSSYIFEIIAGSTNFVAYP